MPMPERMFQVATLKATPVGERWLGALGEPVAGAQSDRCNRDRG